MRCGSFRAVRRVERLLARLRETSGHDGGPMRRDNVGPLGAHMRDPPSHLKLQT
jgi:hypothetical protein